MKKANQNEIPDSMNTECKSIIRNALKNKGITLLNILGMTSGFVCTILIVSWVMHEASFDSFVPGKEHIYRVVLQGDINGTPQKVAGCFQGVAEEAMRAIPEVVNAIRISVSYTHTGSVIKTEGNNYFRILGIAADSALFDLFPYRMLSGDPENALNKRNSIVVDIDMARQCFGNELAIGKTLFVDGQRYTVTAVLEDIPTNSHLEFHYIIPTLNLDRGWHNNKWGGDNALVYLKLMPGSDPERVNEKIKELFKENLPPTLKGVGITSALQPLKDIPYEEGFSWDYARKANKNNIFILSGVAFLIMLIACINFTNLFISTVLKREKEAGIRIASGASPGSIALGYFWEVFLYVLTSFILAVVVIKMVHPYFNELTGANVEVTILSWRFFLLGLSLVLATSIISGTFPALHLIRINIAEVVKAAKGPSIKGRVRQIMVGSQYVIAIVLLTCMIAIFKQVIYLQTKDLGFDKDNVLCVYSSGSLSDPGRQKTLKEEILKSPYISKVAYIGSLPTEWNTGGLVSTTPGNYEIHMEELYVDRDYFDLSNIRFIEGGNAFLQAPDSLNYCIMNEAAVQALHLTPPYLDQTIYTANSQSKPFVIKGVITNVNTKTLSQQVGPCYYLLPRYYSQTGILMFKIQSDNTKAIRALQAYWEKEFPNQPLEYWYLDQTYHQLYQAEIKARAIISWFTSIALILTTLGLFAMAYFMTEKRVKEVGIRKVNGARISQVLWLLNKDFLTWVAVAFVIATPIAWYAMTRWLESFAYKTPLNWWIFALAGVLALAIALLTVSWQSWKAATRNPVESLRTE